MVSRALVVFPLFRQSPSANTVVIQDRGRDRDEDFCKRACAACFYRWQPP